MTNQRQEHLRLWSLARQRIEEYGPKSLIKGNYVRDGEYCAVSVAFPKTASPQYEEYLRRNRCYDNHDNWLVFVRETVTDTELSVRSSLVAANDRFVGTNADRYKHVLRHARLMEGLWSLACEMDAMTHEPL